MEYRPKSDPGRPNRRVGPKKNGIAIVGVSCRLPGDSDSPERLWQLLVNGGDAVGPLPDQRWDTDAYYHSDPTRSGKMYTSAGGYLKNLDQFDAEFFGISPREASRMDPQQRLLLEMAWEALEVAGQSPDRIAGSNTSVYVGISGGDYGHLQYRDIGSVNAYTNVGLAASIVANRVSHFLDLRGPSMVVDTACSSSLVAMHEACRGIWAGEASMALVGGVNVILRPDLSVGFCKASMLSPTNHCHSFGAEADGYARAEGGAVCVLKPLDKAEEDGDPILGVILASGANSDGHTKGIFLPSEEAQAALLRDVYRQAGVRPRDVCYVEAHGTGTPAGDPIECRAIGSVMGQGRGNGDKCYIGSIKSNIGHLEPAAGLAGLLKVLLALKHRVLPATIGSKKPNPDISFDEMNVEVVRANTPLPRRSEPLVMGVNSFGFGGANAHVVVQEYRPAKSRTARVSPVSELANVPLLLSAQDEDALKELARASGSLLRDKIEPSGLYDVCYTAAFRRAHLDHRLVVYGGSAEEVADKLADFAEDEAPELTFAETVLSRQARIAFVFCGNGPQWWSMGQELLAHNGTFGARVREVDALFRPLAGWSIIEELQSGEANSRLERTEYAQPALFAVQLGILSVLQDRGLSAEAVLGHSVGEVAAAFASGALSLEQAVHVIYHRSHCQAPTAGMGKMAALGVSAEKAEELIRPYGGRLVIGGINSPNSVTLTGDPAALEDLGMNLEDEGVFFRVLDLDYAFHSDTMDAIRAPLLKALGDLKPSKTSVRFVSTVTGKDLAGTRLGARYWWRNVREPVLFADAIGTLVEDDVKIFVEIGPHPVLAAYIGECARGHDVQAKAVPTLRREEPEEDSLRGALATVHGLGGSIDLSRLFAEPGAFVSLPSYPWQRERHWNEGPEPTPDHPLLGPRETAADGVWSRELDSPSLDYLNDHVVQGVPVFPAAGYLEMGVAAALKLGEAECYDLEDVDIRKALPIPEGQVPFVHFSVNQDDSTFRICSRPSLTEGTWTLNVLGRLGNAPVKSRPDTVDVEAIRGRLAQELPTQAFYDAVKLCGLQYKKRFQAVKAIWCDQDEVFAQVALPGGMRGATNGYHLHPSLLDACFQVVPCLVVLDMASRSRESFLPVQIKRLRYYRSKARLAYCHGRIVRHGMRSVLADMRLLDAKGRVIAEIEEFRYQKIDLSGAAVDEVPIYEPRTRLMPRTTCAVSPLFAKPKDLESFGERIAMRAPGIVADLELEPYYTDIIPKADSLCAAFAVRALEGLGAGRGPFTVETLMLPAVEREKLSPKVNGDARPRYEPSPATRARAELRARNLAGVRSYLEDALPNAAKLDWPRTKKGELKVDRKTLERHGGLAEVAPLLEDAGPAVQPIYERMIARLIEIAREDGLVHGSDGVWELDQAAAHVDPGKIWRELAAEFPFGLPELVLLGRCGENLVPILTGAKDPLEIINLATLEFAYDASPNFSLYNHLIGETTAEIVRRWPKDRALRILEIGAGTGASTSKILQHVPEDMTEYVFTDVSDAFLAAAEIKFSNFSFMRYAILDIERDPAAQGFDPHGYDIVVAANVLHATRDLDQTLRRVRSLLAKNGLLVLTEAHRQRTLDLIFGPLKGWWVFEDLQLRRDSPLLQPEVWPGVLGAAGFDGVRIVNEGREGAQPLQSMILARNPSLDLEPETDPEATEEAPRTWLLLADGLSDDYGLTRSLPAAGHRVIRVEPGQAFEKRSDHVFAVRPDAAEDFEDLCRYLKDQDVAVDEIVHLWGISDTEAEEPDELLEIQNRRCLSTIYLIQSLRSTGWEEHPRLWLVTTGAVAHPGHDAPTCPLQAPLWGLGRVIQNEHPELSCRMVDLNPDENVHELGRLLSDELRRPDEEQEILLSLGARFGTRVSRTSTEELAGSSSGTGSGKGKAEGFQLDFTAQGTLENLYLKPVPKPKPGAGQVVIEVKAAGLNFRDVMWAMGMLPEEALENGFAGPTLGMECSGVVSAVGPDVDGLSVGDEVIAFAPSCFSKFVLADAIAVSHKPPQLGFSEAATIPSVFFTAYYALDTLARLRPGERVLIHGAAGGVGLAAIQIAKHVGAEIFATAGTPEKRQFVELLGADHVLDSRSLEFADRIVEITDGAGVDVVLNSLAGEAIYRNLKLLKPFGRFLEIGKRDFYANSKIGLRPFSNNISYFGIDADQFLVERRELAGQVFGEMVDLIRDGTLRPLVHRTFPISRVVEAFRYMQQSKHIGKIVITMDDPRVEVARPALGQPELDADASYLVTGGLGGFGLASAQWLVARGARNLILVGRRGAATAEAKAVVAEMRKAGVKVVAAKADVTREKDLRRVLDGAAAKLPPLRGVVHAAMVLDDGILLQSDRDRFMRVLEPKVLGAWNLHRLTRVSPLDFFVVYSSATTLFGNPGQGNYVAANLFLESLISHRRSLGLPGLSVSWGAIEDVGYLSRHEELLSQIEDRIDMRAVASTDSLAVLGELVTGGAEHAVAANFNWARTLSAIPSGKSPRFEWVRAQVSEDGADAGQAEEVWALLAELNDEERLTTVTQLMTEQVAKTLRLPVAKVDVNKSLLDMGIDSLMGVEMKMVIDQQFGIDLPAMELMGGASIVQLSARILRLVSLPEAQAKPASDAKKALFDEIDKEVEELSEEALDVYLAQLASDDPELVKPAL